MKGEQAIFNLQIKKKSGLSLNPDIHHYKVFSSRDKFNLGWSSNLKDPALNIKVKCARLFKKRKFSHLKRAHEMQFFFREKYEIHEPIFLFSLETLTGDKYIQW